MDSTLRNPRVLVTEADFEKELGRPVEDLQTRIDLWDTPFVQNWFSKRGYRLYRGVYDEEGPTGYMSPSPSSSILDLESNPFPYAYQGGDGIEPRDTHSFSVPAETTGNVLYGQDSDDHHVAIKLVKADTDEYRIFRLLYEQGIPNSQDEFNCVIPVLDLLQLRSYWFAVMPRWGIYLDRPEPATMAEIFTLMHRLLKGLNFLHDHRIAHGDIVLGNALVNHFGKYTSWDPRNPLRLKLRSQGCLTYAWFDFDISTMFPQSSSLDKCRLPYEKSWQGTPSYFLPDTWQGEYDFNPFAFDVCSLGIALCDEYQHLTCIAPMLAPLLDRMVTRNISGRFTAREALHFFEMQVYPNTTEEQLKVRPQQKTSSQSYEEYNRWDCLEPAFVKSWAAYREPPVPPTTKLLRIICRYQLGYRFVSSIRKAFCWI